MGWLLLYISFWILNIFWCIIFSIYDKEIVRNGGSALFILGGGVTAVGFVAVWLEADIGVGMLLVLAFGMGALVLPMLLIIKYFETGRYYNRFKKHKRGNNCCYIGHNWIRLEDGGCFAKCSVCGFTRKDEHNWVFNEALGIEKCHCGLERKVEKVYKIDSAHKPCTKNEGKHHISGCTCEYCGAIIFEANHEWNCLKHSDNDGSGEANYVCKKCGLKRFKSWNPYNESTWYDHDRLTNKI